MAKAAAGELDGVTSLAATEVEDTVLMGKLEDCGEQVHFTAGDILIIYNIPVRLEVERIENGAPPVGMDMFLKIEHRAENFSLLAVSASVGRLT
jgi:hypothetical protein